MLDRLRFLYYCCKGRFVTFQYFLQHEVLSSWLWIQSKTIIDQVEREKRELLCCKPFDFIQINFYLSKLKAKTISFIEVEEKFVNILKIKLNCVNFCSHNINFVRIKMKLIICLVSRQVLIIHNSNNADCHHSSS